MDSRLPTNQLHLFYFKQLHVDASASQHSPAEAAREPAAPGLERNLVY